MPLLSTPKAVIWPPPTACACARSASRANLRAVKLAKNKGAAGLLFYQGDGAAWDEFTVEGAREMMSFDAGEFELTATGEKPAEKPAEPDL